MPIAYCSVSPEIDLIIDGLIERWAQESGQSSEHMTINVVPQFAQCGRAYAAMANLYLPSFWPDKHANELKIGLARALAKTFEQPLEKIHVITHVVHSGSVVENEQILEW